jgi:hypothetical protein
VETDGMLAKSYGRCLANQSGGACVRYPCQSRANEGIDITIVLRFHT